MVVAKLRAVKVLMPFVWCSGFLIYIQPGYYMPIDMDCKLGCSCHLNKLAVRTTHYSKEWAPLDNHQNQTIAKSPSKQIIIIGWNLNKISKFHMNNPHSKCEYFEHNSSNKSKFHQETTLFLKGKYHFHSNFETYISRTRFSNTSNTYLQTFNKLIQDPKWFHKS